MSKVNIRRILLLSFICAHEFLICMNQNALFLWISLVILLFRLWSFTDDKRSRKQQFISFSFHCLHAKQKRNWKSPQILNVRSGNNSNFSIFYSTEFFLLAHKSMYRLCTKPQITIIIGIYLAPKEQYIIFTIIGLKFYLRTQTIITLFIISP